MSHVGGDVPRSQLVWDWPIRVFHWGLVLAVVTLFVTGKLGGNWLEWHKRAGFLVIGLIVFRLLWGFVGGHHARFASFVRGPKAIIDYIRGKSSESIGHNPLGALSVLAMLAVLAFQAGSGLFANDDIMLEGPYASVVGKEMSDLLTRLHKLNSWLIVGLVSLHVVAIAFYFFRKKTNLTTPMLTGRKVVSAPLPASNSPAWLAPVLIVLVTATVYLLVKR